jgi:hypothetical protein
VRQQFDQAALPAAKRHELIEKENVHLRPGSTLYQASCPVITFGMVAHRIAR